MNLLVVVILIMLPRFCAFALLSLPFGASAADNPTFMLVSGISAPAEMCVSVENGHSDVDGAALVVESCAQSIAAGDGRELWQYLPSGQIASATGKKCISVGAGSVVSLKGCDASGSSQWEAQGSGQLRLSGAGHTCLSMRGLTAGTNVASKSAISASSTADIGAHGASMAVDGSSSTFWASEMDPTEPVTLTVDLGGQHKLESLDLSWEFPAKSFAVSVSSDGVKWAEVYATDSNILASTHVSLGSVSASKVRVVMHEAHALYGVFQGHTVYGISELALSATGLQATVEDCATAAKSHDARDKFFQSFVGEFGMCSSKALRSELPSLEAARASVASTVSELVDVLPKIAACHASTALISNVTQDKDADSKLFSMSSASLRVEASAPSADVDGKNGVPVGSVTALLKEARHVIIAARTSLY